MKVEIISWLAGFSVMFHTPWELVHQERIPNALVQANGILGCRDKPWYIKLRNCSVGIVLDTLYAIGLYYLFFYLKENEMWLLHAGMKEYLIIFIISLVMAYGFEWLALKLGFWEFDQKVARLPKSLGNIALFPVLQLPILVSISF